MAFGTWIRAKREEGLRLLQTAIERVGNAAPHRRLA